MDPILVNVPPWYNLSVTSVVFLESFTNLGWVGNNLSLFVFPAEDEHALSVFIFQLLYGKQASSLQSI